MKSRNGFVSNSSSSSFICAICGETESGRDSCIGDFDMFRCRKCGREFHFECADFPDHLKTDYDLHDYSTEEMPSKFCPFCTMERISQDMILWYMYKKYHTDEFKEMTDIKSKFRTYDDFCRYLGVAVVEEPEDDLIE